MNKAQLTEKVAHASDISKAAAQKAIDTALDAITSSLRNGEAVTLSGFGTFKAVNRKARTGRNPQTGEAIAIKASRVPRFTAARAIKDAVR